MATACGSDKPSRTSRWDAWSRAPREMALPFNLRVILTSNMSKIGIKRTRQGNSKTDPRLERCEGVITEAQARKNPIVSEPTSPINTFAGCTLKNKNPAKEVIRHKAKPATGA